MTRIVPSNEDLERVREMRLRWPALSDEVAAALAVEAERHRVRAACVNVCRNVGRSFKGKSEAPLVVTERCASAVKEVR